jgi:hypothetical protein
MQKSFRVTLLVAAIIILGFFAWHWLFPNPEEVIRARLKKLAETASFEPKDGTIRRALKASSVPEFFTTNVEIVVDVPGGRTQALSGRAEIQRAATGAVQELRGLKTEFLDINVKLGSDKQTAVANLTGKFTPQGDYDFIVQEMNFMLRKVDGKWLIFRIETVKTLSFAPGKNIATQFLADSAALHPLVQRRPLTKRF